MESIYCKTSSTADRPKPLRVKLFETPPERRRAFVECVLDSLIESRFGPGAVLCEIVEFDEFLELEREPRYDLTAVCHVRPGVLSDRGHSITDLTDFFSDDFLHHDLAVRSANVALLLPPNHAPPNLGRNAA